MGEHLWNEKIKITMESCCEVQPSGTFLYMWVMVCMTCTDLADSIKKFGIKWY